MTDPSMNNDSTSLNEASTDRGAEDLKAAFVSGAHDVKDGLADLTHDVVEQTKKGTESQLTSGKARASDGLRDVAKALRSASEQMRADENDMLTGYIDRAAGKVSDASDYLKDHSLGELSTEVKTFARREPALFLGGALVLGLIGGRFLKSSSPESRSSGSAGQRQPQTLQARRAPIRSTAQSMSQPYPATSSPRSLGQTELNAKPELGFAPKSNPSVA